MILTDTVFSQVFTHCKNCCKRKISRIIPRTVILTGEDVFTVSPEMKEMGISPAVFQDIPVNYKRKRYSVKGDRDLLPEVFTRWKAEQVLIIHYLELRFQATRIISECNRACAISRNKFKEAVLPGWVYTCHLYEKQVSGRTVSILFTAFYR